MFDYEEYRKSAADPMQIVQYQEMTRELEHLIRHAAPEDIERLVSYRAPVTVACLEFYNCIKVNMSQDDAREHAIKVYAKQQQNGWIDRTPEEEVLWQADQKRAREEKLSKEELKEELAAFLAKRKG